MKSIRIYRNAMIAVVSVLIASPALAAGTGNACAVSSASTLRLSGLIEEYNQYTQSIEKVSSQISKYLANPRNFENGPVDFDTAQPSRTSSRSISPAPRLGAKDLAREVSSGATDAAKKTGKTAL